MNVRSETEPTHHAPALECAGLRKAFGPVVAVDDLSLTVGPSELLALLGPSGCGKTTTLRLIAGFETPDAGAIRIGGRPAVGPRTLLPPERRRVGMVFQDYALFPHLSVAGNVRYGLGAPPRPAAPAGGRRQRLTAPLRERWRRRPRWRTDPTTAARVQEALELVSLTHLAHRYPHELSGGEAQRVALARALAPHPTLILLDEPFSNLDVPLRAAVRAEVRAILKQADAAAVFVTHDQEEAFSLADRVAVMLAGRVQQVGRPQEIYRRPASRAVAAFLGDADFLPGRVGAGGVHTELGLLALDPAEPLRGDVDVLIRPEAVRLEAAPATTTAATTATAEVIDRQYYGHDQVLALRLPSGAVLHARLGASDEHRLGDRVRLHLDPLVRIFPRA